MSVMKQDVEKYMKFFTDCLIQLKSYNVEIKFTTNKKVFVDFDNTYTKGFFDDSSNPRKPILACSVSGDLEEWITVFAHEFCHFLQWKEKKKIWQEYSKLDGDILERCINNKPIKKQTLEKYLNCVRDMELDCEKRTVKLLKKYKLPIDYKKYIQAANIYVHYYNYIKICRSWYTKNGMPPYQIKEILDSVKPEFYKSYSEIPENLLLLFQKNFPAKKKSELI
jgi:hypothetical protein